MDISFNISDGYCAVKPIKDLCVKYKCLRPLVLVMKAFLRQRGLNDTHTGGIGSFLVVVLVTAFLQHQIKQQTGIQKERTLGEILYDLLAFYGEEFNYRELGISIVGEGMFYKKQTMDENLSVENPQDPDLDIGKSVRDFPNIARNFMIAREKLKQSGWSLGSIIGTVSGMKKIKN